MSQRTVSWESASVGSGPGCLTLASTLVVVLTSSSLVCRWLAPVAQFLSLSSFTTNLQSVVEELIQTRQPLAGQRGSAGVGPSRKSEMGRSTTEPSCSEYCYKLGRHVHRAVMPECTGVVMHLCTV